MADTEREVIRRSLDGDLVKNLIGKAVGAIEAVRHTIGEGVLRESESTTVPFTGNIVAVQCRLGCASQVQYRRPGHKNT